MKKILFVINNMHIGGTRTSLLNLLNLMPHNQVKVHLYLLSDNGEYMDKIDKRVTVIKTSWSSNAIYAQLSEITIMQKIFRGFILVAKKIWGANKILQCVNKKIVQNVNKHNYDMAIAYSEGEPICFLEWVSTKKKFAWIHNDFKNLGYIGAGFYTSLQCLDNIFFVAQAALESFKSVYPEFSCKLNVIRNTIDFDRIKQLANESESQCKYLPDTINIVSVGRLSAQKAFDRIPKLAKKLKEDKVRFNWHIIGGGEMESEIRALIMASGLDDVVIMHGPQCNPYPYIRNADLLVVTSIYESQPMVILEALTLGTPVISTNFSSAYEILGNKSYGCLAGNTVEEIYVVLRENLCSGKIVDMKNECSGFVYDNLKIVDQILAL